MKAVLALVSMASAMPASAEAQALGPSLQVVGQAGLLGEWDLVATVALQDASKATDYAGSLTMTHVGMCTQDGPEKKVGDMRLQISSWTSRMTATLQIEGVTCTFTGKFSGSYTGMMTCPDRRAVPLTLWVK